MFLTPRLEAVCVRGLAYVWASRFRALRALSDVTGRIPDRIGVRGCPVCGAQYVRRQGGRPLCHGPNDCIGGLLGRLAPLLLALLLALLPGAGILTIDSIGIAKILLFSQSSVLRSPLIAGSVRGDLFDAERATSS